MKTLCIRNWDKWQTYRKDRGQPPWIKIYRRLMHDVSWIELSDAQRGQLVAIWLLAGDHDGVIPASAESIKKICHMDSEPDLNLFIKQGFIETAPDGCQADANVTPERRQDDAPEAETEESRGEESREEKIGAHALDTIFFEGNYVKRITERTVLEWLKANPLHTRESILSALQNCDAYHAGNPTRPDNWFFTVSSWVSRDHKRMLDDQKRSSAEEDAIYSSVDWDGKDRWRTERRAKLQ